MAAAYQGVLVPVLRKKTQSEEDAMEIAGMVVEKFWNRFVNRGEDPPKNVNGYLFVMANNAFIAFARERKKREHSTVELDVNRLKHSFSDRLESEPNYEEGKKQEQKEQVYVAMEDAVRKLGEKCRELLHLNIFERKRIKDIFQGLGIPTANAATKKKDACIRNLRKLLYVEIRNLQITDYGSLI